MENPIKMDDLEVPLFLETPIWIIWSTHFSSNKHNLKSQNSP